MARAIILTANKYQGQASDLRYCHDDGELLAGALINYCGFRDGDVLHIRLSNHTADAITAELHRGNPEPDVLILFFAGHGLYDADTKASYLLPPSYDPRRLTETALEIKNLRTTILESYQACVMILDACHSGVDVRGRGPNDSPLQERFVEGLLMQAVERSAIAAAGKRSWEIVAACDEDEKAIESDNLHHGLFTYCLEKAIVEAPPGTRLSLLDLTESARMKMRDWIQGEPSRQNPVMIARTYQKIYIGERNLLSSKPSPLYLTNSDECIDIGIALGCGSKELVLSAKSNASKIDCTVKSTDPHEPFFLRPNSQKTSLEFSVQRTETQEAMPNKEPIRCSWKNARLSLTFWADRMLVRYTPLNEQRSTTVSVSITL